MSKSPITHRSFKTVTFRTVPSIYTMPETDIRTVCKSHPKQYLELYCAFCEKPVCAKCKVTTHARHVTDVKGSDALDKAAKLRRRHLVRLLDAKQNQTVPSIKNTVIQIMESRGKLQHQLDTAIEKYQDYVTRHRDKMAVAEEEWIGDVMYRASRFYQTMDEKVEFLKRKLQDVTSTISLINDELKDANNAELLLLFAVLRTGLESIHPPIWPREEVRISLSIESLPEFGAVFMPSEEGSVDKNCQLEFSQEIVEPTIYTRVFDTTLPVPRKILEDEHAKISLSWADEMFVSFGEYIVVYPLDNRRYTKPGANIRFNRVITVRQNIIDIACHPTKGDLYFLVMNAVKKVSHFSNKIIKSFSLFFTPSAICMSSPTDEVEAIFVGFHDAGKIIKFSTKGEILMELFHPDSKMIYRPRHLAINYVGDIFFSDDISNITVLDMNGIWKCAIQRDVKGPPATRVLKPSGIACTQQRHVLIIDANTVPNIHIFSEDGKYLQTAVFKNLQDAYVLNVDKTEDVWVAFKDGRLRIYRPRYITSDVS